ncbi:hypothetical protein S245_064727, partial [Arachis hypogaea]
VVDGALLKPGRRLHGICDVPGKAKKNKKKLPRGEKKTSGVGPEGQPQEISLSHNAPQSKVQHVTNSYNIQEGLSDVAFTTQSNQTRRLKNPVVRPHLHRP